MKTKMPRSATLKGHGTVKILEYKGRGYFLVETPRGGKVLAHRVRLGMRKK